MSSSRPATRPMPSVSCPCSIVRSPAVGWRRGRSPPMAVMPASTISKPPGRAACAMSPSTKSAAWRSKTWSRAAGSIAGCGTSAPGSRPGSLASSAPTVWHAVLGAGSITSRLTSGPRWWPTIWYYSPALNWHSRAGSDRLTGGRRPNRLTCSRSPNDSATLHCHSNAKDYHTLSIPAPPGACYAAEKHAFLDGHYLVFPVIALLFRNRSNRMLLAALIACALIVGVTGAMVDLERTTHGLLVFLRFLPEFVGGMVLYSLYERGLPKWFGHDATFWLSIVALPLLEWLRAPNGLMLCALGLVLLTSATNEGHPTRLLNAPV